MIGFLLLYCIKISKHWKVLTIHFAEGLHLFSDFIDKKPVTIVFDKLRVLAKLRNPCKLSFFRFHFSAWFFKILTCFQARYVACQLESFNGL